MYVQIIWAQGNGHGRVCGDSLPPPRVLSLTRSYVKESQITIHSHIFPLIFDILLHTAAPGLSLPCNIHHCDHFYRSHYKVIKSHFFQTYYFGQGGHLQNGGKSSKCVDASAAETVRGKNSDRERAPTRRGTTRRPETTAGRLGQQPHIVIAARTFHVGRSTPRRSPIGNLATWQRQ